MRKKISFVILSNSGAPAKQVCTSKNVIYSIVLSTVVFLAGIGYFGYDYYKLKRSSSQIKQRGADIAAQMNHQVDQITSQRRQIQDFAGEITELKKHILALNQFEKKIRIIVNLDEPDSPDNLFGVGGSIPEDLDAKIPLKEKHQSLMREMHDQIDTIDLAAVNQKLGFDSLLKSLEDQQNLLAATPTIRPISKQEQSWITSTFGYRKSPFTNKRELHKGYDIATRKGAPIFATGDGVVTFAGNKGLLGKTVIINHGHGVITRYGHCSKLLKKRGEKVKRWDTIALVGNTGRSTGPHVHYEVHLNGIAVNPKKYILN